MPDAIKRNEVLLNSNSPMQISPKCCAASLSFFSFFFLVFLFFFLSCLVFLSFSFLFCFLVFLRLLSAASLSADLSFFLSLSSSVSLSVCKPFFSFAFCSLLTYPSFFSCLFQSPCLFGRLVLLSFLPSRASVSFLLSESLLFLSFFLQPPGLQTYSFFLSCSISLSVC